MIQFTQSVGQWQSLSQSPVTTQWHSPQNLEVSEYVKKKVTKYSAEYSGICTMIVSSFSHRYKYLLQHGPVLLVTLLPYYTTYLRIAER